MAYSPSLCKTFDLYRCHIAEHMWLVMSPILLIIGTVGNILSICVLLRKHMRKYAVSVYLVGVACADLGVLYIGLLREWLMHLIEIDFRKTNSVACRLQIWLQFLAFTSSVWILTAFSIDRYLSISWPLFAKRRCTTKINIGVVCSIPVFIMLFASHYFLLEKQTTYKWSNVTNASEVYIVRCEPREGSYFKFYYKVWAPMTLVLFSILPAILVFISNVSILKVMWSRHRSIAPASANTTIANRAKGKNSINKMLIATAFFYLFSTAPVCVYMLLESYLFPVNTPTNVVNRKLFWAIASLFFYSNSAFNFVVYCFSGTLFRYNLKEMIVSALQFLLAKLTRSAQTRDSDMPTLSTYQPSLSIQGSSLQQQKSPVKLNVLRCNDKPWQDKLEAKQNTEC